jgi:hypothetical protein
MEIGSVLEARSVKGLAAVGTAGGAEWELAAAARVSVLRI